MKFKIPVIWKVYSHIEIEAENLEEAIKIFDEEESSGIGYPLPLDPEYVDGSFRRDTDKDFIAFINEE